MTNGGGGGWPELYTIPAHVGFGHEGVILSLMSSMPVSILFNIVLHNVFIL